ncbi:MAG: cold-shock protein [Sciscionella sp.]
MTTRGIVRFWLDEDGWGVVDSPETPGGCWTHFSVICTAGFRSLAVGQEVELEWEAPGQDGYPFRAVRTWPTGQEPIEPPHNPEEPGSAFHSTLTITWDSEYPN